MIRSVLLKKRNRHENYALPEKACIPASGLPAFGHDRRGLIPAASVADSDAFAGWQTDEWTVGEEGGEPVLIGSRSKTLNLLYSDPTASPEVAELDPEFTEQASLGGFVASGGEVSLGQGARDGALVYTLDGTGTYLQSPTIVAPVREGYAFKGWVDTEGNAVVLESFTMPAADVILTAAWEALEVETPADTDEVTSPAESDTAGPIPSPPRLLPTEQTARTRPTAISDPTPTMLGKVVAPSRSPGHPPRVLWPPWRFCGKRKRTGPVGRSVTPRGVLGVCEGTRREWSGA